MASTGQTLYQGMRNDEPRIQELAALEDTASDIDFYQDDIDLEETSVGSSDLEREWEENKEQLRLLFSLVIFPFVGKWLGRKFSFWVWSRCLSHLTSSGTKARLIGA
ncbi:hypothetical protein BZG36_01025 [Bifiguratus adelaidae]|uniref:Uncharacterized protein n=1 Tax=Bifiguratus adelaidae TaxID=1938954 RepID=A0A261Y6D3_9FUNG|nr:hypothetical protein BZG36_01025 [Bifiguratus adelaidae]